MIVNGKEMNLQPMTLQSLLTELNLFPEKVVVEVNLAIIPKENYTDHLLQKEDQIEIISFVGGG